MVYSDGIPTTREQATLKAKIQLLRDCHFIRITGLPAGDDIIWSHPANYGFWSNHQGFVYAVTQEGDVWVNIEPEHPDLRRQQHDCLCQVCPGGMVGMIFEIDEIPTRYLLARANEPFANFDPRVHH